jgi:hypothetical protein
MGKVGIVRPLRGEAALVVCYQPRAPLLRVDLRKRRRRTLLVGELLSETGLEGGGIARRLFGDLAYRGGTLGEELSGRAVLAGYRKGRQRRPPIRQQQVEVCFAALKCVFGMDRTLAKTLTGLVTRIAAKVSA